MWTGCLGNKPPHPPPLPPHSRGFVHLLDFDIERCATRRARDRSEEAGGESTTLRRVLLRAKDSWVVSSRLVSQLAGSNGQEECSTGHYSYDMGDSWILCQKGTCRESVTKKWLRAEVRLRSKAKSAGVSEGRGSPVPSCPLIFCPVASQRSKARRSADTYRSKYRKRGTEDATRDASRHDTTRHEAEGGCGAWHCTVLYFELSV